MYALLPYCPAAIAIEPLIHASERVLEIHKVDPSAETLKTIEEVVSKPKEVVEAPTLAASRQASGLAGSRQTSSSSLGAGRRDSAQFTAVRACTPP